MPKKRRTRKQKEASSFRRQQFPTEVSLTETPAPSQAQPSSQAMYRLEQQTSPKSSPQQPIVTKDYQYLVHDLRKTLLVTGSIVCIQLLLFFFFITGK